MDSDELPSINDPTDAAWAAQQRSRVIAYLASEKVEHAGVSVEPRWFLSPYVAVWAIRSKADSGRIGWCAISGDLPTDYITCTTERSDADVLRSFSRQWKALAVQMASGIRSPHYHVGLVDREKEFAPMLQARAELLEDFARDIESSR